MLDPLTPRDRRLLMGCVVAIAIFGTFGVRFFHRAFPEAAIELRVTRGQARSIAERLLIDHGAPIAGGGARWHFASRFSTDDTPKVYLERTLGLERANLLYGRRARIWSWDLRWFQSGRKEEWRASITPLGDVVGFMHALPESAAGARLTEAEARVRADGLLAGLGIGPVRSIGATSRTLPRRTDWSFEVEALQPPMGEATVRYKVGIAGDRPVSFREFVKVPERWERDYRRLRSANETTGQVDSVFLLLTFLALIAVLVQKVVRKDVPWGIATAFGAVAFVLGLLSQLNALPISIYDYDTASPYPAFLTRQVVLALMGAAAQAVLVALLVAGAEPIYRERFPDHLSLRGTFSGRGLRTRATFTGIVLGYALMAFFLAYQVGFYIVADRLGAWAPAEVPYDDLLNTTLPWATVLLIGFLPAVSEEFISRVFSISFLRRFTGSRVVLLAIPALIWGFGHAAYPNQPFYIRGLEVGIAGVLVGAVFMRYGIVPVLVWHYSVDAGYTSLLMLRSGNPYYIVSGVAAAGILLVPLGFALASRLRRGGFEPEAGLTNADEGVVAPPPAAAVEEAAPPAPVVAALAPRLLRLAAVIAGALMLTLAIPARPIGDDVRDGIGRTQARVRARAFLVARGERPERYREAIYTGTNFADESEMEHTRPDETGRLAGYSPDAAFYVLDHGGSAAYRELTELRLPVALWVVRFFRPGEKAEWKVALDARSGRVVEFVRPVEESDSAGTPPSLAEAERRVREEARRLAYPIAEYAVIDTGIQRRPHRVDTRMTLEAGGAAIGEARPRLTAVFQGDRLAGLWPSIKLPEAFLRARRSHGALYWIGMVARVAAGGYLLSVMIVVAIAAIRGGAVRRAHLLPPLAVWLPLAALAAVDTWPSLWRVYPTELPLGTFQATLAVVIVVRLLMTGVLGLVVFALIEAARPGWRAALRHGGSWTDAIARVAVVVAGATGVRQVARVLADRLPAAFVGQGFLPSSLEALVPGYETFFGALQRVLLLAGVAAVAALALRAPPLSRPAGRLMVAGLVLVVLMPFGARSAAEFGGPLLVTVLGVAWTVVTLMLLRDHARAWALYAGVAAARGGVELMRQGVTEDRLQGMLALALAITAVAALTAGRRPARSPAS